MKIATIELIKEVIHHPNADTLDIVTVLGYQAIVKRDSFKKDDLCVFIQPDTILPDAEWAKLYKAKSSRVRAVKLRGSWSMGIVESTKILFDVVNLTGDVSSIIGADVHQLLRITKYEAPVPQCLEAKGNLPFNLQKTDEERWQNHDTLPWGTLVDVTLKIDGSSMTVYHGVEERTNEEKSGITSRSLDLKLGVSNNYTQVNVKLQLLEKLKAFCANSGKTNLAFRGEVYGSNIQKFSHNPHSGKLLSFALFNVLDLSTGKYFGPESDLYFENFSLKFGIPIVPILEKQVTLTPELIAKYDHELVTIDGLPFEGVVIKLPGGESFKVINKHYDAKKS